MYSDNCFVGRATFSFDDWKKNCYGIHSMDKGSADHRRPSNSPLAVVAYYGDSLTAHRIYWNSIFHKFCCLFICVKSLGSGCRFKLCGFGRPRLKCHPYPVLQLGHFVRSPCAHRTQTNGTNNKHYKERLLCKWTICTFSFICSHSRWRWWRKRRSHPTVNSIHFALRQRIMHIYCNFISI